MRGDGRLQLLRAFRGRGFKATDAAGAVAGFKKDERAEDLAAQVGEEVGGTKGGCPEIPLSMRMNLCQLPASKSSQPCVPVPSA